MSRPMAVPGCWSAPSATPMARASRPTATSCCSRAIPAPCSTMRRCATAGSCCRARSDGNMFYERVTFTCGGRIINAGRCSTRPASAASTTASSSGWRRATRRAPARAALAREAALPRADHARCAALCAEPERRTAPRPCAVGADRLRAWRDASAAAFCCASRISTSPAAGRTTSRASTADLAWLGMTLGGAGAAPIGAFRRLRRRGRAASRRWASLYPCFATRAEIAAASDPAALDPDGAPLYPGLHRHLPDAEIVRRTRARRAVRAASRHGQGAGGWPSSGWSASR